MATWVAGIDEAGKGPVIGPMVLAISAIEHDKEPHLKAAGVKDSKMLTQPQREALVKRIKGWTMHHLIVMDPEEIDEAVLSDTLNLNWLEAIHTAKLIDHIAAELSKKHQVLGKVYVDCPSNNIKSYETYLKGRLKHKDVEIAAEHKADVNHPIVGAASILAKVKREELIGELKKKHKVDFGSGYPADPYTQAFIKENYEKYPGLFRKSWASYQNLVKAKRQRSLGDF